MLYPRNLALLCNIDKEENQQLPIPSGSQVITVVEPNMFTVDKVYRKKQFVDFRSLKSDLKMGMLCCNASVQLL